LHVILANATAANHYPAQVFATVINAQTVSMLGITVVALIAIVAWGTKNALAKRTGLKRSMVDIFECGATV